MHPLDAHVTALADANEGVVLTRHMVASGLTQAEIRAIRPRLHRLCQGAYALRRPENPENRHRLTARGTVQRYGTQVALSHISAAVTHELPIWRANFDRVHLTAVDRCEVRRGLRHGVHSHVGPLPMTDREMVAGIPVTTRARTAVDCARTLSLEQAVAILDAVLHQKSATPEALAAGVEALTTQQGVARARRALELADGRAESPGETRTRLILRRAGMTPEPQVEIRDGGRSVARVDLLIAGTVVVEFDGRAKYRLGGDVEAAHWDEKRRQNLLEAAGYRVIRFAWDDLDRPDLMVTSVRAAVAGTAVRV